MKIQYKRQKFQADAAKAVVDVFTGQPYQPPVRGMDGTVAAAPRDSAKNGGFIGWSNQRIVPELSDRQILEQLNRVRQANRIPPAAGLEGREDGYQLTIEMETGVGKTYTYIKTMYELNRAYGWSKFMIVVPSIAVREGVYKTFCMTQEHFAAEYGKKVRFFLYNSARLTEIDRFASDSAMSAMIINAQAFNARGKDARRIYMKLDAFRSRRPIDIIAQTNPILILDEPQSVEGKQTKERLREFRPLLTLRYSATHRQDSIYNMVYRLDAVDAYNRQLVKRIAVKGITETGSAAADGYLYLESINLSRSDPTATLQLEGRTADGALKKKSRIVRTGDDLYELSGGLEAYRDGFVVERIDGRDDSVAFRNGIRIYAGDVVGAAEEQLRRIQIRETILSHIQRERQLFRRGIKVLSLFFIDEVAKYRVYDAAGQPVNGTYAAMFEEEYQDVVRHLKLSGIEEAYGAYLRSIPAAKTHAGYFSVDGRGRMTDGRIGRKENLSEDADAYELIMKNKELLLDCDPARSPVRFLFSHSALREGWDNPNVFQICTLKHSGSDVRKRQEVGRGLRLCVDRNGERMDRAALGDEIHAVNVLTVIASESYDAFARGLQAELAEAFADRAGESNLRPENARRSRVELQIDEEKLAMPEFQALWSKIGRKAVYTVAFDTAELIRKAVSVLDDRLHVSGHYFRVESGRMQSICSQEELLSGDSFVKDAFGGYGAGAEAASCVKYDLVGRLVEETGLTRGTVIAILQGIRPDVFGQFGRNPEDFMGKAAALINEEKAAVVVGHITYEVLEERYDMDVLTDPVIRGKAGENVMRTGKHLYDHIVCDSAGEREFAMALEADPKVAVYVKLPAGFCLSTPLGRFHPGWAVVLREGAAEPGYFMVKVKGAGNAGRPDRTEEAKELCAGEYFRAVSDGTVVYDAAGSYREWRRKIAARFVK